MKNYKGWRFNYYLWREKIYIKLHVPIFCTLIIFYWMLYILVIGWFSYLFFPKTYVIRAGLIKEDINKKDAVATPWWHRYECKAAKLASSLNNPNDIVRFTWRKHPIFLDNEFMYVKSKGYNVRVWNSRIKNYRKS